MPLLPWEPAPLVRPEPPELVPARMVNEVLYCERLMYLEWAQGEFADNHFTVEGRQIHARVDHPGGKLPPPPPAGALKDNEGGPRDEAGRDEAGRGGDATPPAAAGEPPYRARSLWISSDALQLTGKIDVVEGDASGEVVPIEFKRGRAPEVAEAAYLPERAQLCAQGLLLRGEGYPCTHGAIWFDGSKKRVLIPFDAELEATTRRAIARCQELTRAGRLPPPLTDSPKCNGCSLVGICLPDEVSRLGDSAGEADAASGEPAPSDPAVGDGEGSEDDDPAAEPEPMRRLHPARDDAIPLYVQEQGARIGLRGELLTVHGKEATLEARLPNTSQVCLYGNVQISTQALRALIDRGIPVSFLSTGGWFVGRAVGHGSKNVELRMAQHRAAAEPGTSLGLARGFIASKIRNCRTLLRRNHVTPDPVVLNELTQLARKAEVAPSAESLLGLEGTAARFYFGAFTGMLSGDDALADFALEGRNRRPPRDRVNALLSFSYSLLAKEYTLACTTAGLDPLLGFFHRPRHGRPALALDLMEELRPVIGDSVVVTAINTGVIRKSDFIVRPGAVSMKPEGRRRLIQAFERRMDQLVTHPTFGYRVSYRRILEVQARLLGRFLLGEIEALPALRVR